MRNINHKNTRIRRVALTLGLAALPFFIGCATQAPTDTATPPKKTSQNLLDTDLSQWDIWLGVPHSTVSGLPAGTYQSDNVHKGTPLGLNPNKINQQKGVFTTIDDNGETILRISGEIYGGLTSKSEYANYHLSMKMKWGEKKWAPRLEVKRDSGLLYHCHGEHGAFWQSWMSCLEYQVQEKDFGDFIPLADTNATYRGTLKPKQFNLDSNKRHRASGDYIHASSEPDLPNGQWNTLDIYVLGDKAVHLVNGEVVFAISEATDLKNNPLTQGRIQIQSEAAECFYKNITLSPISKFPETLGDVF